MRAQRSRTTQNDITNAKNPIADATQKEMVFTTVISYPVEEERRCSNSETGRIWEIASSQAGPRPALHINAGQKWQNISWFKTLSLSASSIGLSQLIIEYQASLSHFGHSLGFFKNLLTFETKSCHFQFHSLHSSFISQTNELPFAVLYSVQQKSLLSREVQHLHRT